MNIIVLYLFPYKKVMFNNTILFKNNTYLPVIVDYWISYNSYTILNPITVEPYTSNFITSSSGEWYVHSMFCNEKRNLWNISEFKNITNIGIFRNKSSFIGKYSWMENNLFDLIYSSNYDNSNENKIIITLILK